MKGLRTHCNQQLARWRMPPGVPAPHLWYRLMRRGLRMILGPGWGVRAYNRHFEPTSGSVVYISNHQSFMDPTLIGFALQRPLNYMARDSLFRIPLFGTLISWVYAFPVRRDSADLAAMKEAMRRLKAGGQLVVFAEGTRTRDGRIGPMLPGVAMLAQRSADWTVPVVIDGAHEAWPRSQPFPNMGRIVVQFGQPIPKAEARKYEAKELVDHVRDILIDMQTDIRRRLGRGELKYD